MADETKKTGEEWINSIYDAQLQSEKSQLESNYTQAMSDLDAAKQKQQKATDAALTRTAVENQKQVGNWNEVQNAYGLSSGANAQARLAMDNQLTANLTALRQQQNDADAELERQRVLAGQKYQNAILEAQANNDFERAKALYAQAKQDDADMKTDQMNSAALLANAGDFSLYASIFGWTPEQTAAARNYWLQQQNKTTGKSGGSSGGRSSGGSSKTADGLSNEELAALLGITPEQAAGLTPQQIAGIPGLGDIIGNAFGDAVGGITGNGNGNTWRNDSAYSSADAAEDAVTEVVAAFFAYGPKNMSFDGFLQQMGITMPYDVALAKQLYNGYAKGGK